MNVVEEARQNYKKIQKNLSSQLEELYATLLRACETDFGLLVEQNSCVQTFQDYNKFLSEREETYTREEFLFPSSDDSENYQKQIAALTFAKNALNLKNLEANLLNSVKNRKAKALESYHSLCDMALTIAPQKCDPQKAAALLAAVPSLNNETNCTTLLTYGGDLIEEAPLSKIEEAKKTIAKSGVVSFYTFPPQKRPSAAPTIQRHKNNCDSSKTFYKKSASEKAQFLKKWQTAAVIFLPLLAFILSMIFLPFEAIAARMFPSILIACACFSVCSFIFNRLAKGTYQKTLKAIDAIYAGFDSFCEQTEKQIVNKFYNDYAAALKRHKTQENYLDQLAFYEQELTELSALHEKNVLLCSEKTAFLPAQFDYEQVCVALEQMQKGIATNFKEAIGQATQIIEKRREQEEARRREQEREERLAKAEERREQERRMIQERHNREMLESQLRAEAYAREQAEAQQRQARELERQSEFAKNAAEAQQKQAEYAKEQARRTQELVDNDRERRREGK